MTIEVYSAPGCSQCDATKHWLQREGFEYNEFDVLADNEAFDRCKAMGYSELPVVVAYSQHWSGFRYDKLREIKVLSRG